MSDVGELTGLPLAKFATAELIARARRAGCHTLWEYVELLEQAVETPCVDPTHHDLLQYARHLDDCMKPITGRCSCELDQVLA